MSWKSVLANIGGAIAAPFTGGASLALGSIAGKALDAAGNIGKTSGDAAAARAKARLDEANYNLNRDQLASSNAQGNISGDSARLKQMLQLGLLGNMQDAVVEPPEHIKARMGAVTGGMRPSAVGNQSDVIAAMRPRLLQALLSGQHMPGLTPTPQPNGLDKGLGWAGLLGSMAGSLTNQTPGSGTPAPSPGANVVRPGQTLPGLKGYTF